MPVVPRNELDGFLLWVFSCMLSNRKQMDNMVGEETALSTYILNNENFFFPLYRQLLCASYFIIHIRLPEQDISV